MTIIRPVAAGQPLQIRAPEWNTIAAAVNDRTLRGPQSRFHRPHAASPIVWVKNTTGAVVQSRGILGIDGSDFDSLDDIELFQNRIVLKGATPSFPKHFGRFVVTLEPIDDEGVGRAYIAGLIAVQIDVPTGATSPRYAEIKNGSTTRLAGRTGGGSAKVLWVESGTGADKWAIVDLGAGRPVLSARIASTSSLGSNRWSYTCEEVVHSTAGTWTVVSGGASVTARNRIEAANDGSGLEGNGVDRSNLPGGWSMKPISVGNIVELVGPYGAAESEWWEFGHPNSDDGACP